MSMPDLGDVGGGAGGCLIVLLLPLLILAGSGAFMQQQAPPRGARGGEASVPHKLNYPSQVRGSS
jgi:hypothetical protein